MLYNQIKTIFPSLPSDFCNQSREWFFPGIHFDDPDTGHHFIHNADSVVTKDCRFTPAKKYNSNLGFSFFIMLGKTTVFT